MRTASRLLAFLTVLLTGAASATGLPPGFFPIHRSEPFLLNRQIDPALLRGLKIWDTRLVTWRTMQPNEAPSERAQVLVLHLWADWCGPCREEFPVIRDTAEGLEKVFGERVQAVLLSETSAPEAMRAFLEKQRANMPRGPQFLDVGEMIAASLRTDLPTPLSYPITLVLDAQRVVRHAVVGPIASRRGDLVASINRVLTESRQSSHTPSR